MDEQVSVTISSSSLRAALNCLGACAADPQEPEDYRAWYAEARNELARASEPPA